jgi:hypothetical protein
VPVGVAGAAPETRPLLEHERAIARKLGHRCARSEHLLLAAAFAVATVGSRPTHALEPDRLVAGNDRVVAEPYDRSTRSTSRGYARAAKHRPVQPALRSPEALRDHDRRSRRR